MTITIPGKPQPKQRARRGKGGRWYTPKETKAFESSVGAYAWHGVCQQKWWDLDGRFAVELDIYFPDKRRRDIDNVAKSVLDGCNGILWDDDSQVVELVLKRFLDRENPRTVMRVEIV